MLGVRLNQDPIYASITAGMTGQDYHTQLLLVEMGSCEFFLGPAANLNPPDLCLQN
jgi:hypothetical protein